MKGYLPVGESFGFNQDLRANTGGQGFPQCVFDHWEILQEDPYKQGGKAEKMVLDIQREKEENKKFLIIKNIQIDYDKHIII